MAAAAVIAQQHHEKFDGTGYIEMVGEEIHLYARIVAIADVFDALLSDRPYKQAWTPEQACRHIISNSGTHFDPRLVQIFERCKDTLIAIKKRYTK
jgi:HD-GYP domain-containing protein (c-di-GMP phosphodiesterase class II)